MALWRYDPFFRRDPLLDSSLQDWPLVSSRVVNEELARESRILDNLARNMAGGLSDVPDMGGVEVVNEGDKLAFNVPVGHYRPEELDVKIGDGVVSIEGCHVEHPTKRGVIKKHFIRRFKVPDNVDQTSVLSHLSKDGILTVEAPKTGITHIPIQRSGGPIDSSKGTNIPKSFA